MSFFSEDDNSGQVSRKHTTSLDTRTVFSGWCREGGSHKHGNGEGEGKKSVAQHVLRYKFNMGEEGRRIGIPIQKFTWGSVLTPWI